MKNMKMKLTTLALTLLVASVVNAENIVKEGSYTDQSVWVPKMISPKTEKLVAAPQILSVETEDLPKDLPKEIGMALKVSLKPVSKDYSHASGVHVLLNQSVPKGAVLTVSFWAKSISGAKIVSLRRSYGASGEALVMLSDKWEKYEEMTIGQWVVAGSGICLSLIKQNAHGLQPLAEGQFMIADLVVEIELPKNEKSEEKSK